MITVNGPGMVAWHVLSRRGVVINTVFFQKGMTADEVKRSLVDHDGYPDNITVRARDNE